MSAGPPAERRRALSMDRKLDEALVSALGVPEVLGQRFVLRRILAVGQTMVLGIADDPIVILPAMVKILRPGYRKRGFKHLREEVRASDRMRYIDRGVGRDLARPPFIAGDALVVSRWRSWLPRRASCRPR
ncbi:MAG: hypothetical protein HC834_06950 [Rhodospirillales bacterium]|nr:hypothetical protein [Rhodospirillales bacterium]